MSECVVCNQSNWRKRYTIKSWDILECEHCQFSKISPFPERATRPEFYSREVGDVRTKAKKRSFLRRLSASSKTRFKRLTGRHKDVIFFEKLKRHLKLGAPVLDVACADGAFITRAKQQFKCTGIDISDHLVSLARKAHPDCELIVGDYQSADFKGQTFDGITIISLLEHLDDPLGALKKSFELLNPGGVLLLKTVNYAGLNRKLMHEKWTGFRPPDHMVYFTPKNLRQLLEKIGFSKTQMSAQPFNDNMYCDAWK